MKRHTHTISLATILIAFSAFGQTPNSGNRGSVADFEPQQLSSASVSSDVVSSPKRDRLKNKELPQVSVIDKLLSIESALSAGLNRSTEEEWARDYNELYQKFRKNGTLSDIRSGGKNSAYTALALGIKASDGVLALKARNIEALQSASEQIKVLARKLGANEGELGMADTVKIYADKGQWFNAFLALGRLQRDMLGYLRSHPEKTDLAVLVIVGGWLQGGRCVTHVIDKHYNDYVSNVLREQRFVDMIRENMEKLAPVYLNDPLVAEIIKELPEIRSRVDVGLQEAVKHEDVKWLHLKFDELVTLVMTPDPPPPPPAPTEAPTPESPAAQPQPLDAATDTPAAKAVAPLAATNKPPLTQPQTLESSDPSPPPVVQPAPKRGYWTITGGTLLVVAVAVFFIYWKGSRRAV